MASSARSRSRGMRRQPEVVVRREVDDLPIVERRRRLLLVVEDAEMAVQALLLQRIELGGEVGERIGRGQRQPREPRQARRESRRERGESRRSRGAHPERRGRRCAGSHPRGSPEAGAVDAQHARRAEQAEHVVLVGGAGREPDLRHDIERGGWRHHVTPGMARPSRSPVSVARSWSAARNSPDGVRSPVRVAGTVYCIGDRTAVHRPAF